MEIEAILAILTEALKGQEAALTNFVKEIPFKKMEIHAPAGVPKTLAAESGFKTLYVDNSANGVVCTIQLDSDLTTFTIPASSGGYVPCEGVETFTVTSANNVNVRAFNRNLRG